VSPWTTNRRLRQEPWPSEDRPQSLGEEIANSVSHGVGCLAAVAAVPILIVAASPRGSVAVAGATIFGATAFVLYLASTLYHALPANRAKRVFHILDHSAIFLLIAGTYTPFTIGILHGAWGWTILVIVWTAAILGVVSKAVAGIRFPHLSTVLYVAMGWVVLVAIRPLWARMPSAGWIWLLAGGASYTLGVAFYAASRRVKYAHFVWHMCVLAGTTCHFFAVLWYAT
jgi:hemolysin III